MTRWIERKKDWLGNRKHREERLDKPAEQEKKVEGGDYGVTFIPIKCPRCGSKKVKCYSSRPGIRYYRCKDCQHRFKAIEAENS